MPDRSTPQPPDVNQLVADAERALKDGAYVAVGLGVLAFQRAAVQRRQVVKELERRRAAWQGHAGSLPLDRPVSRVVDQLGDATVALSSRLDEVGRSLAANADSTRAQLRELARSVERAVTPARCELERQADALEQRLPGPAREALAGVRNAVAAPEARLRAAVGLD